MFDLACFVHGNRKGKPLLIRPLIFSCFAVSLTTTLLSSTATAQVHGPGPSDPSLFDTVINLPDDQESIGGSIGNSNGAQTPTTQLNVADGGNAGSRFEAGSGSEVNVSGGTVSGSFQASGSEVNISGGSFGDFFWAYPGSYVSISGGTMGENF